MYERVEGKQMYKRVELTITEALLSERSEIRFAAVEKVEWYQNIRPSKLPEDLFTRKWKFKIKLTLLEAIANLYSQQQELDYSVDKCTTPGLHPFLK
jgi:hypothetical protein